MARMRTIWRVAAWVVAALFALPHLAAQGRPADEVLSRTPPAERAALLIRYAQQAERTDPPTALRYARDAVKQAPTAAVSTAALTQQAEIERALGDYDHALADANEALARADTLGDSRLRGRAWYAVGRTQWSLSNLPASIAAYRRGIDQATAANDLETLVDLHIGLGVSVNDTGDHTGGREQMSVALGLAEKIGDKTRIGTAMTDLGNDALMRGDLIRGKDLHEQAREQFAEAGDLVGHATALINLGTVAEKEGDLQKALSSYQEARQEYGKLGIKRALINADRQLGTALAKLGRMADARKEYNEAITLGQQLGSHTVLANIFRELSDAEQHAGNYEAALTAARQYAAEHDLVLGEKSQADLAQLNARYDAEHRDREIASLCAERVERTAADLKNRARVYLIVGLLLFGLLGAAAMVGRQRAILVTERKVAQEAQRARETAEQADRVKTRLLGIASHDLKGPLGNILQIAEELLAERETGAVHDERLDWISVEASRLVRLVQDLLDTAALETGRLEIRKAPLDLADVVRAAVTAQRWQLQEKRQRVVWDEPAAGYAQVLGDADRLRQVVENVLGNASKFAPKDSAVTIGMTKHAERLVLTIRDEGPGLTAKDREGLFMPFSRLTAQPTGKEISHGLGLSIVLEVVRLHGGDIVVDSEPGKGATFRISLPAT